LFMSHRADTEAEKNSLKRANKSGSGVDNSQETYILVCMSNKRESEKTRKCVVEAGFSEIYRHGFQAARTEDITAKTGLTRGALYHHFRNKHALGKAVLEELISGAVCARFIEPLAKCADPITGLDRIITKACRDLSDREIELGCPLNNLALEMSPVDEDFRQAIDKIYSGWEQAIEKAISLGQKHGKVAADVVPRQVAAFVVASLAGCRSMAKNRQSRKHLTASVGQLRRYLYSLRP